MLRMMKQLCPFGSIVAAMALATCSAPLWAAPNVVNGDFEADTGLWVVWPGYVSGAAGDLVNPANITGWTGSGGHGINPVVPNGPTDAPFRDNGDNTSSVAFLQGVSSIEQTVSGFVVGQPYVLSLDFNARNCCGDFPIGTIFLNGIQAGSSTDLFPDPGSIIPVGGTNAWYSAEIAFDAPTTEITVRIEAMPGAGGDATMLVDNVAFTLVPEPASSVLGLLGMLGLLAARRR
jgi:hypothetical protein